jgi:hypothetical protein
MALQIYLQPPEHLYFVSYWFSCGLIKTNFVQAYATSSGTPFSLHHSVTSISLRYLRPLRCIIAPSIHSFIRRASGFPQHKYLRHSISLRLYLFDFAGSISSYHTSIPSANATFAQSKPIVRYIPFLLYPCFSALLFCLPTMLCFI